MKREKLVLKQKASKEKEQNLTGMLLFVSLAYAVTTLPYRLLQPVMEIKEVKAMYDMTLPYWRYRFSIIVFVTANLWFWNSAANFYLYCIGGGKRYRDDTKAVIGQLCSCLHR